LVRVERGAEMASSWGTAAASRTACVVAFEIMRTVCLGERRERAVRILMISVGCRSSGRDRMDV